MCTRHAAFYKRARAGTGYCICTALRLDAWLNHLMGTFKHLVVIAYYTKTLQLSLSTLPFNGQKLAVAHFVTIVQSHLCMHSLRHSNHLLQCGRYDHVTL